MFTGTTRSHTTVLPPHHQHLVTSRWFLPIPKTPQHHRWSPIIRGQIEISDAPAFCSSTSAHRSLKSHLPDALSACSHMFIRHDAIKRSLQPPFTGPFPVIKRSPKYYTVTVNGRQQTVSSDHLKPAFFEGPESTLSCPSSPDTPPTQSTRSGRTGRFPDRLTYWYCRDWSPLSYVYDDL